MGRHKYKLNKEKKVPVKIYIKEYDVKLIDVLLNNKNISRSQFFQDLVTNYFKNK